MIDQTRPLSLASIWQCPNCQLPLRSDVKSMQCDNRHVFDKAKQGYCNLLLANQKAAKEPGDSREMIDARRAFLSAGHYQALVESLCYLILKYRELTNPKTNLLDLGCGEGYYLNALSTALTAQLEGEVYAYGIDISKVANRRAAAHYKSAEFSVASTFNLPVLDNAVDLALCVFAPLSMAEVKRVLQPKTGLLVRVSPGPRHLFQIKQAIYDDVQLHDKPKTPEGFDCLHSSALHYELELNQADYEQLIAMTPLNWHGKEDGKKQLLLAEKSKVEVDFDIQLYRINSA